MGSWEGSIRVSDWTLQRRRRPSSLTLMGFCSGRRRSGRVLEGRKEDRRGDLEIGKGIEIYLKELGQEVDDHEGFSWRGFGEKRCRRGGDRFSR